ncbi:MAG: hypothetical protein KF729_12350 [Sandaracinaceae bacterium]|nr:hypothetical protein [Sandaracinaceae bacterium]
MKVRDALGAYFARHGLDRGGYAARRFRVPLGLVTLTFPNPGRLHLHDLHHVALDAPPTFWGEVEVSALELRAGPPTALIALLCVGALALGCLVGPARTARAWRRARGARHLYGEAYEALLEEELATLRERVGLAGLDAS